MSATDTINTSAVDERPIVLSVADFKRRTGLSHSKVYEMIATGELATFSCGRRRLIPMGAVDDWIASRLQEAGAA